MSRLQSVYLIMRGISYEGADPIRAFRNKAVAEALAAEAEAYERTAPYGPGHDADDAEWDQYLLNEEKWVESHPVGKDHGGDSYYVIELPIISDNGSV